MFDAISLNDGIVGSRFDQKQVIGFQMSLPSALHPGSRWKFAGDVSASPKRNPHEVDHHSLGAVAGERESRREVLALR